ncbi:hypothetical protein [Niallia sp. RD1]|uniref:hypothetical protein n=1 Tax=Niallia sp. RD1 TaxID=2962858 RepID=UPI0020C19A5C|nr:hypothetical protein [Niallia sp. RD1]UTI42443.1 hypothetical protein NKG37_01395 [Niallia sp. RD1]
MLTDSLKQSIYMIDAFLMQKQYGTLIVDDGQAYLDLPVGELITLNDSFKIEVINDGEYISITYDEAVNTMSTDGWSLFAGLQARVK